MLILFTSLFGLWFVLMGYRLFFKLADIQEFIKGLVFISVTGLLLSSKAEGLISYVYESALSIMSSSSAVAFDVAGGNSVVDASNSNYAGLTRLAEAAQKAYVKVFQIAYAVASSGSLMNALNWVYALLLIIPYFLLIAAYSSQVVVAVFRAMMVAVFAPFLFVGFAFDWGRSMAKTGINTLLASIMVLFASTAALALAVYGVSNIDVPPDMMRGEGLKNFVSITNPQFLTILALGWIGTGLMAEGVSIANSIAGTALTNTAAGMMTAGAATVGLAGAARAKQAATTAAKVGGIGALGAVLQGTGAQQNALGNAIGNSAAANRVTNLMDKFKNINTPGGSL